MLNAADFPAAGRVLEVEDDSVIFQPLGTTYRWKLLTASRYAGPVNQRIECVVRAAARKVYTVPSGGNFVAPIVGPPRMVQGRIRHGDDQQIIVHASVPIIVELPAEETAIDLTHGPLAVAALANVVVLPGARFEPLTRQAAVAST